MGGLKAGILRHVGYQTIGLMHIYNLRKKLVIGPSPVRIEEQKKNFL